MPENSADFVCFGALNVDLYYVVDTLPYVDGESYVIDVKTFSGGSAANTAVALAEFGNEVIFVGAVGRDYGSFLEGELRKKGVIPLLNYGERSGKAMVFVDKAGRRAIVVDPGVNDEVKDFPDVEGKLLHLTSFVCKKSDNPFLAQIKAAENFGEVSLDPGPIYARRKDVMKLVEKCTVFLPNKNEIETITKKDYREGAKEILKSMDGVVVVKLGKEGCYATDGDIEIRVDAFKVKAVDTTGAGDAFNAGFLHAWIRGYDLEMCLKAGNFSAAKCVKSYGARNFPNRMEMEKFLNECV